METFSLGPLVASRPMMSFPSECPVTNPHTSASQRMHATIKWKEADIVWRNKKNGTAKIKFNPSLSPLWPWTFASLARSNICIGWTSFIWRRETPFQQICGSAPTIWSNQCCATFPPSLLSLRSPCSASVSLQITQWARDPILKMALIRACCHRHAGITEVRSQKTNTPAVASLLWWLNH